MPPYTEPHAPGGRRHEGEHRQGCAERMAPELTAYVEGVMPSSVQLCQKAIELVADHGNLSAERLRDRTRRRSVVRRLAGRPFYARRSFTHRMSSFSVCRVRASGFVTIRRQPTYPMTAPIASTMPPTISAAIQPGR